MVGAQKDFIARITTYKWQNGGRTERFHRPHHDERFQTSERVRPTFEVSEDVGPSSEAFSCSEDVGPSSEAFSVPIHSDTHRNHLGAGMRSELAKMSAPAPKHSPYLSIVTRTEIISEPECAVFAVNEDRLMYYPAQLLMRKECKHDLPRGSVVCALIQADDCFEPCGTSLVCANRLIGVRLDTKFCPAADDCFEPCGTSLVCANRLIGVRLDTKFCPAGGRKMLFFLSLAYQDFIVLTHLQNLNEKGHIDSYIKQSMHSQKIVSTSYSNTGNSSIWSPASIDSFTLDQHRTWSSQPAVLSTTNSSTNCYNNYPYYRNMDYLSTTTMGHSQFEVK
ncbi:hypothetical protein QE152_g22222 [Popillia japonica]|uniref:Uncharacterized protein n=1 Tax=Popillia japonica TaxID=7064 RepID=A0AAW1KLD6_POPJA